MGEAPLSASAASAAIASAASASAASASASAPASAALPRCLLLRARARRARARVRWLREPDGVRGGERRGTHNSQAPAETETAPHFALLLNSLGYEVMGGNMTENTDMQQRGRGLAAEVVQEARLAASAEAVAEGTSAEAEDATALAGGGEERAQRATPTPPRGIAA